MSRIGTFFLIFVLIATPVLAQGPITTAALSDAAALPPPAQQPVFVRKNPGLMWAGIGIWAAGVTLGILSWSALKKEESGCAIIFNSLSCYYESGTNWPIWGVGMGMIGGGATMWFLGARRVQAPTTQIQQPRLYAEHTIRF